MKASALSWVLLSISVVSVHARDITTLLGETFSDIKITRIEACGIGVMHRSGVAFLDFAVLSADVRWEFGYSEQAYANCKADQKRQYQAWLDYQQQQMAAQAAAAKSAAETIATSADSSSEVSEYASRDYATPRYKRDYSTKSFGGDVHVRGYVRKNGTYVHSYTRSYPHSRK